jgi:hypothetical protein
MLKIQIVPGTEELAAALKNNNGYCLCMPSKTEDTKCPCRDFREAQVEGECHCGRYEKIKVDD